MVEYRANSDLVTDDKLKRGSGRLVGIVALFVVLLAGLLFVSGLWNPRPTQAAMPLAEESAETPAKDMVTGTMKLPVDLPPVDLAKPRMTQD